MNKSESFRNPLDAIPYFIINNRAAGLFRMVLVLVLILLSSQPLYASDRFYTIQTGTYAESALKYAEKQYDRLLTELSGNELDNLRILKGRIFYVVRVGRFKKIHDTGALLGRIKTMVPDAFVLKSHDTEGFATARLYKKNEKVPEEYYTLQLGTFLRFVQAQQEVDSTARNLKEKDIRDLRIERVDRYYSVRLGKFESYTSAKEFRGHIGKPVLESVILKACMKDEHTVSIYAKSSVSQSRVAEGNPASQGRVHGKDKLPLKDTGINNKKVETLLDEVSSYYDNDEYGKAAGALRKGLARYPGNPDLHAWYGATLLNLEFPDKAYEEYKKAIRIAPDVPDYHAGLGYSLLDIHMEKIRKSVDAFTKALEIDPDNVAALEGLGIAYVSMDKKDLANEIYDRLRVLDIEAAERLNKIIKWGLDWGE
ncbi:sporulation related domain protein [bacterium BMS3Abin07]|nr:sporulation related domain protein [bacterium BMS3Abin07]GBE31610.1 sporulation related domain protein [bacterium BMS3Bbin05]